MILSNFKELKVIPVIKINSLDDVLPLADALTEGGLPVAEITFRTSFAKDAIKILKQKRPEMIVGAGTVLDTNTAKVAIDSGADFIVSPGLDIDIAKFCKDQSILYIPGCVTPTEIMTASRLGLSVLKFFPAETFGGVKAIKSLAAAFVNIKFMPTGGINEYNLKEYLECEAVYCCGGSFMVKDSLINSGDFSEITRLTKLACEIVKGI